MHSAHRKGWCPGALRPMASGDGLIVRLRIIGGTLRPDLIRALAECAEDYGNGLIELSARANLQLRGVRDQTLRALQARLDALRLLDEDPAAEAVRNILASPLAGLDPCAVLDIRPLVAGLDERLRSDGALHQLPGKFLFLFDDGGSWVLPREAADVAFVATRDKERPFFAVYLGGVIAGACAVGETGEVAARLADAFLRWRNEDHHRMKDLVGHVGVASIARAAHLAGEARGAPTPRCPARVLGFHELGGYQALGLGIAFGRFDARSMRRLADQVAACRGELRLSPWRAVFMIAEKIDATIAGDLQAEGFILAEDAPVRAVAACSGMPACSQATTASQADGAYLAELLRPFAANGVALHVSACPKGCAYPRPAPFTLVGRGGAYDLVLDGRAGDRPRQQGLALADVERLLSRLAQMEPAERAADVGTRNSGAIR